MVKKSCLLKVNSHTSLINGRYCIHFENSFIKKNSPKLVNSEIYQDNVLIHLHTRSIHNIVIKALKTIFEGKEIKLKERFIEIINSSSDISIEEFKEAIGAKASLPFEHTNNKISIIEINSFLHFNYKYDVIDLKEEEKSILQFLEDNNIDKERYYSFINKLNCQIISLGLFSKQEQVLKAKV